MAPAGRSRRPLRGPDGEVEPWLPWDLSDYRNRLLRAVRAHAPELLEQLESLCATVDPTDRSRAIALLASQWDLEVPWLVATMERTVRWWLRAPQMRRTRTWAPVLPVNGWGHRLRPSRQNTQLRGMKPSPHDKIQEPRVFDWWARYQVGQETFRAIATESGVEPDAVRMAVHRLSELLKIPQRRGTRGRPKKPTA